MENNQMNFDPMTGQPISNGPQPVNQPVVDQNSVETLNVNPQQNMQTQNQFVQPNQPVMQQYPNNQVQYGTPVKKKSNVGFIITVILLSLIILGLVLYLLFGQKLKSSNSNNNLTGNDPNQTIDTNVGTEVAQTNALQLEGYEMTIPTGYTIQQQDGQTVLVNKMDKVVVIPHVEKYVTYSEHVSYATSLKTDFEAEGITVTGYDQKTYGGRQWLIFNLVYEGEKEQIAVTSLDTYHIFGVVVYNVGTKTDEEIYTALNTMVTTAKNGGASSFSSEEQKGQPSSSNYKYTNVKSLLD